MKHLTWLTAIAAAGCSYTEQVDVSDHSAFFPVARIRIDRGARFDSAPDDTSKEDAGARSFVDGEISATRATGSLDIGEPVGGAGNYDVRDFSLLVRVGRRDAAIDGAFLAGLQFGEVDLEVQGPTSVRNLGTAWLGVALGVEGGVTPVESLRAYLRLLPFFGAPSAVIIQAELGLEWAVVDPVRLIGGYRYWDLQSEGVNLGFGSTSLDLTLSGPFVGVMLEF